MPVTTGAGAEDPALTVGPGREYHGPVPGRTDRPQQEGDPHVPTLAATARPDLRPSDRRPGALPACRRNQSPAAPSAPDRPANRGVRTAVPFETVQASFAEPDMIYAPFMFWFWDEPLDPAKMAEMSRSMASQRFSPGYAHARKSMVGTPDLPDSEWLGDKWFAAFDAALKEAEAQQNYLGYCDEYWWPSFQANGRVLRPNPELRAESLKWKIIDVPGGSEVPCRRRFLRWPPKWTRPGPHPQQDAPDDRRGRAVCLESAGRDGRGASMFSTPIARPGRTARRSITSTPVSLRRSSTSRSNPTPAASGTSWAAPSPATSSTTRAITAGGWPGRTRSTNATGNATAAISASGCPCGRPGRRRRLRPGPLGMVRSRLRHLRRELPGRDRLAREARHVHDRPLLGGGHPAPGQRRRRPPEDAARVTMPGQDCLGRKALHVHDFKEIASVAEFRAGAPRPS